MRNLDLEAKEKAEIFQAMTAAVANEDEKAFADAMCKMAENIQQKVLREAEAARSAVDAGVLAQRGTRQLTTKETEYYSKVIEAMRTNKPSQALNDLDVVMPETIINDVFSDLETNHELLNAIDFQYGIGISTWLMNANERQLATWSPLCAEIVKELTSGFKSLSISQNKLSAFLPVCKAMLDLGPVWLDRYVRAVLREALASGLEDGIINGRGQGQNINEPIGMRKDLAGAVDQTTGYPDKAPVSVTRLDAVTYGELIAPMAKTENGNPRVVSAVLLVVNPTDYLTKVMPATTYLTPNGTYANNVLPFPTRIVQSVAVAEGEAIIGIPDRYLFVSGSGKDGIMAYSDEYRFLEDERVYLTKMYGHGQAKDNNSFQLLDISGLEPLVQRVEVVGGTANP